MGCMTGNFLFPVAQEEIKDSGLDNLLYVTYNRTSTNQNWSTGAMIDLQCNRNCLRTIQLFTHKILYVRACTGFDGGFEVWEAIRSSGTASPTWKLNLNADENLAYAA